MLFVYENKSNPLISFSKTFLATAPAATLATVSLPEALPPPLWSNMPNFLK
jgi:hypothetical protein